MPSFHRETFTCSSELSGRLIEVPLHLVIGNSMTAVRVDSPCCLAGLARLDPFDEAEAPFCTQCHRVTIAVEGYKWASNPDPAEVLALFSDWLSHRPEVVSLEEIFLADKLAQALIRYVKATRAEELFLSEQLRRRGVRGA